MFYCPNCRNLLDITKTVGKKVQSNDELSITESIDEELEQETEIEEQQGGTKDQLDNFINGEDITQKIDIDKLKASPNFKALSQEEREKVFNRAMNHNQQFVTSTQKSEETDMSKAYYICNSCGYNTPILPGSHILSRSSDTSYHEDVYFEYEDLLYDTTLPITRNYTCQNTQCKSNSDVNVREAVFKRFNGYHLRYVCRACKTSWIHS